MAERKQGDHLEPIYSSSEDTGSSPEDPPEAMNDREMWRKRSEMSVPMARHDDDEVEEFVDFKFLNETTLLELTVSFSNGTRRKLMHNATAYQLLRYYKILRVWATT